MTVDELLARESIRHTLASYCMAGDSKTAADFIPLFADDAVFEFVGHPPVGDLPALPGFRCEGREQIDPTARWVQQKAAARSSFVRHNIATSKIELTGPDTARARTYFIVMTDIGPDHSGYYTDDLVRQGDHWVFAQRIIRLDWRSPDSIYP